MESFDSSPNYTRAAKKENSSGGSEFDDAISVTSSTCGSSVNGPINTQKLNNNGVKHRISNKKGFGSVKSFRRRAKSRILQSPIAVSDDSLADPSDSSPHYLKATSCSNGKKTRSSDDGSDQNGSCKSLQTISRTPSIRSMRFLMKKASFKPKRASLSYSKVSGDVTVDRATYSSTLKDLKFPKPVEILREGMESDKGSALKVCRYHHCSLHGHCHASGDSVPPPPKRFLYKKRRSLKKQKSVIPKTEPNNSSGKKKNLPKNQTAPIVHQDRIDVGIAYGVDSCSENFPEQGTQLFGDIELGLLEVAFGETSFPERSYQDNLDIMRNYSSKELSVYCLSCSCHKREQADPTIPLVRVTSSILENGHKNEAPQIGNDDIHDTTSFKNDMFSNEASNPETSVISDEVSILNSVFSPPSDRHTSPDSYSEQEGEIRAESNPAGGSKVNEVKQDKDSEVDSSTINGGGKLQFSKPRHISMWNLIHQHMSSNISADQSAEKVEDSLTAKNSSISNRELSGSDLGLEKNEAEDQEIEIRKLFAIKLVREAIEKILLPEVQDQASDDQSVTSEATPRIEITERNQAEGFGKENHADSDANEGEGPGENASSNQKEDRMVDGEASIPVIEESNKKVARKTENKAPKHWSNLKKWILLQRFIKALEKVKKFNPKKPNLLPLTPDPEAEKVNLRPLTVDDRKNAEEWMLDYALRQAVNELAPTQKRKVALLVKAFETVVPTQEEPQVPFRISRLVDISRNKEDSESQEKGSKSINNSEKPFDLIDNSDESRIGVETKSYDENPNSGKSQPSSTERSLILEGNGETEEAEDDLGAVQQEKIVTEKDAISEGGEGIEMERKNHIKMWHMIYQHVVSGIAEKVGSQLLDESEDDEVGDNNPRQENKGFTKSDALKLIKDAVDEILLPDSSDTRSVTSESISDQEMSVDVKAESPLRSKNWSKLKTHMLLKRSIRALEKARKTGGQSRHLSSQTADHPEAEKVDLRKQMMDERNKAEQWMLDYAVQHIVTKLTPARKRRVSMLVEAFEAIVPLPEV